jgi:hypothetical protein
MCEEIKEKPSDGIVDDNLTKGEFENLVNSKGSSLVQDLFAMIVKEKKWWMFPIVLSILLIAVVVVLTQSVAAPFIYTLF